MKCTHCDASMTTIENTKPYCRFHWYKNCWLADNSIEELESLAHHPEDVDEYRAVIELLVEKAKTASLTEYDIYSNHCYECRTCWPEATYMGGNPIEKHCQEGQELLKKYRQVQQAQQIKKYHQAQQND